MFVEYVIYPKVYIFDLKLIFCRWIPDNVSVTLCRVPPVGQVQVRVFEGFGIHLGEPL